MERPVPVKRGIESLTIGLGLAFTLSGTIVAFSVQVGAWRTRLENLEARAAQSEQQSKQLAELQGDVRQVREHVQALKDGRAADTQQLKDMDDKLLRIGRLVWKMCKSQPKSSGQCDDI